MTGYTFSRIICDLIKLRIPYLYWKYPIKVDMREREREFFHPQSITCLYSLGTINGCNLIIESLKRGSEEGK